MAANLDATPGANGVISLNGVRTQNLKGIDVEFPINALVAVTGVSGAGKSSFAMFTLAAEGRRRFIETFPAAARRFLERLERPDCDQISPLPPAIIQQHQRRRPGRRSTVASLSEVSATLQQLFTSAGQIYCPECQIPVVAHSALSIANWLLHIPGNTRFQVGFPYALDSTSIADLGASELLEAGFQRIIVNGKTLTLKVPLPADWPAAAEWQVIVDRLQTGRVTSERLIDSLEQALQRGGGSCGVILHDASMSAGQAWELDGEGVRRLTFHTRHICTGCQREFQPLNPRQFAFNSPLGACTTCRGLGVLPDGICPDCRGSRLNRESLSVRCGKRSFGEILALTIQEAAELTVTWTDELDESTIQFARPWFVQLGRRLALLSRLGLGHLHLNRSGQALSTGESHRLSLAAICAVELVNSLYVLEEPASGLHPRDIEHLVNVLTDLKLRKNTVVITEHVRRMIQSAEVVADLGPGAGPDGGQLVHLGTPQSLLETPESVTGAYLSGRDTVRTRKRRTATSWLEISGVTFRNLQEVQVQFPLGTLCVVTGVSGSGKSSLVRDTLYPAVCAGLSQPIEVAETGSYRELHGFETLQSVLYLDQTVLEKTSRGNVATASDIWPEVRSILGGTPEAKLRQFTPGTFSFHNANGGRCPHCEGRGTLSIDLQFLADLNMTCPECGGTRFQREVLEVKYRGLHVAEILGLTVSAALPFFRGRSRLQRRLKAIRDVGLGFLQLGQPLTTLSGGESQRLKLASRMMAKPSGAILFLLDEPARGLHPADIQNLVNWFNDLLDEGHSFIVVEHREELINVADHVIELGPGAGPDGGRIVARPT